MKEKIINFCKLLGSFFLFLYSSNIVKFFFSLFNVNINSFGVLGKTILNLGLSIFLTIMIIFIYYKEVKNDFVEFKRNWKSKMLFALKIFAIFMVIKIFASYISVILSNIFNITEITSENQSAITDLLGQYPILMILSAVGLAPIYEEILFRLGFKKCLKNKWLFIIISGTLFGLIHIFPTDLNLSVALIQSIVYVIMGISLAYYYQKYSNIFYSIAIHFYNNLLSIIFILLSFLINLM